MRMFTDPNLIKIMNDQIVVNAIVAVKIGQGEIMTMWKLCLFNQNIIIIIVKKIENSIIDFLNIEFMLNIVMFFVQEKYELNLNMFSNQKFSNDIQESFIMCTIFLNEFL